MPLGSPTGSCTDGVTFPQKQQSLLAGFCLFVCLEPVLLAEGCAGAAPLSWLPVLGSGVYHPTSFWPQNRESIPKGKGFQPQTMAEWIRVPMAELIPKAKSFPWG